jgi:hypothetical protein
MGHRASRWGVALGPAVALAWLGACGGTSYTGAIAGDGGPDAGGDTTVEGSPDARGDSASVRDVTSGSDGPGTGDSGEKDGADGASAADASDATSGTDATDAAGDAADAASEAAPVPCAGTPTSCGPPGECATCTGAVGGDQCIGLVCGCTGAADCLPGYACDPTTFTCTMACAGSSALLVCNGGCCDGTMCQPGLASDACGNVGALCNDCTTDPVEPVCLSDGSCGCNTSSDCPAGAACTNTLCGVTCDALATCNGGCCSSGLCVPGDQPGACALGQATCGTCGGALECLVGSGGDACGCESAQDCPSGQACDPMTHACATACSALAPCNGGCCSAAAGGTCQGGTDPAACGNLGGVCVSCATASVGSACNTVTGGGECGCGSIFDCSNFSFCDNGECGVSCDTSTPCTGGCCSATTGGSCEPGDQATACGGAGVCADCTSAAAGHACLPVAGTSTGGDRCGCWSSDDCATGAACDPWTHLCSAACGANARCNGGCCAGGTCVAGTVTTACGSAGDACDDCTDDVAGTTCVSGACGCNGNGDCLSGLTCDTTSHLCE